MRVGANPDHEIEFEIEPISANIVTKDFFNPKKYKKAWDGSYWGKPWGKIQSQLFYQFMKVEDLIHGNATKSSNEIWNMKLLNKNEGRSKSGSWKNRSDLWTRSFPLKCWIKTLLEIRFWFSLLWTWMLLDYFGRVATY